MMVFINCAGLIACLFIRACCVCIFYLFFSVVVKCINYQSPKMNLVNESVVIIYNFLHQFSSFRDNWQDMVTEEVKSIFRKANRQVDNPKI